MNEKIEKIFYTINELSQLISISAAGIRSKIYRNQIPSFGMIRREIHQQDGFRCPMKMMFLFKNNL